MHFQVFSGVLLAFCIARGIVAAPAPLEITHAPVKTTGGVPDQEETDNLARLKTAEMDANRHLKKMEHILNNPTVPQNAEMIEAAFGKNPQVDKIKNTVQTLQTGKIPVTLQTDPDPSFVAMVKYDGTTHPAKSGETVFGKGFHDPKGTDNMRAATLVHEATHKLANAGDTVDYNNNMIAADDFQTPESGRYGYASHSEPAKTVAELNKDKLWTGLRDGTAQHPAIADLHNNAESYAQFGSMCDAAISNAAVGLRRRALEKRNWETAAIYLIRRQACVMRKKDSNKQPASKNAKLSFTAKTKLGAVTKLSAKKKATGSVAVVPKSRTSLKKSKLPLPKPARLGAKSRVSKSKSQTPKSVKKAAIAQTGKSESKSRIPVPVKKQRKSSSTSRIPVPVKKQSQSSKIPRPVSQKSSSSTHPIVEKSSVDTNAAARQPRLPSKIPVPVKKVRRDLRLSLSKITY